MRRLRAIIPPKRISARLFADNGASAPPKGDGGYAAISSALTGVAVAGVCYGGYLAYEFSVFPEPCKAAMRAAQSHPAVIDAIGSETRRTWVWDGQAGEHVASVSFSLIGEKVAGESRTARIQAKLVKGAEADGSVSWKPLVLLATFSDATIVDLLAKEKSSSDADAASREENRRKAASQLEGV